MTRDRYLPYGGNRAATYTLPTQRGWLAQTRDPSTGLVYLSNRYYDPALAHFISTDPLNNTATPQAANPYTYANDNPVSFSETTGLYAVWDPSGGGYTCFDGCSSAAPWEGSYSGSASPAPSYGGSPRYNPVTKRYRQKDTRGKDQDSLPARGLCPDGSYNYVLCFGGGTIANQKSTGPGLQFSGTPSSCELLAGPAMVGCISTNFAEADSEEGGSSGGGSDEVPSLPLGGGNSSKELARKLADEAAGTGGLEGRTGIDVPDPANPGHMITDIDRVEKGVLWEEKSATWAGDNQRWVDKQITEKLNKYVRARGQLPGYENAPIGVRMTTPNVDPALRSAIEARLEQFRQNNPGIEVLLQWAK